MGAQLDYFLGIFYKVIIIIFKTQKFFLGWGHKKIEYGININILFGNFTFIKFDFYVNVKIIITFYFFFCDF